MLNRRIDKCGSSCICVWFSFSKALFRFDGAWCWRRLFPGRLRGFPFDCCAGSTQLWTGRNVMGAVGDADVLHSLEGFWSLHLMLHTMLTYLYHFVWGFCVCVRNVLMWWANDASHFVYSITHTHRHIDIHIHRVCGRDCGRRSHVFFFHTRLTIC